MESSKSDVLRKVSKEREAIAITKQTLDLLLRHPRRADMIALLVFYRYTALWQATNQPRATVAYVAKGLAWGVEKVTAIRQLLKKHGLIEDVTVTDARGRKKGWFVRVVGYHPSAFTSSGANPVSGISQSVVNTGTNALRTNKGNALRAGRETHTRTAPAVFELPTSEGVQQFAAANGIQSSDADWFYTKMRANGCRNNGQPIADWQAQLLNWQQSGFLPSQKTSRAQRRSPTRKPDVDYSKLTAENAV